MGGGGGIKMASASTPSVNEPTRVWGPPHMDLTSLGPTHYKLRHELLVY